MNPWVKCPLKALAPGVLSVFRQQLALYLRAEGRRRGRMEKGEKSVEPEEPKGPLVPERPWKIYAKYTIYR